MKKPKKRDGFTLIEIVIVLGVIAVLAAVLIPMLTRYINDSKIRRAQRDVQTIGAAIGQFFNDTRRYPVSSDFGGGTKNDVELLVSADGVNPTDVTGDTAQKWLTGKTTDDLDDHLIDNDANYPVATSPKGAGWRGPYLSEIRQDPWGNKYLVNVKFLQPGELHANQKSVFVLSAGPDGEIDTVFEGSGTQVVSPSDDDIVYRLK